MLYGIRIVGTLTPISPEDDFEMDVESFNEIIGTIFKMFVGEFGPTNTLVVSHLELDAEGQVKMRHAHVPPGTDYTTVQFDVAAAA